MRPILLTRLFHWKKHWPSLLFWLLFPMMGTFLFTTVANQFQSEVAVPVGVVVEDDTPLANALYHEVAQAPFLRVQKTSKDEALHLLEKHELDSVFIINKGYEDNIRAGRRNGLLTSYESNVSFAFTPVKEMFLSFVQEETGRAKAAYTVHQLSKQYNRNDNWSFEEITATSKTIQAKESLLETSFSFENRRNQVEQNKQSPWNVWKLWTIFSVLSTLLLSEWVIKENHSNLHVRLAFTRFSFKNYLLRNLILYTALFFLFDLVAFGFFYFFLNKNVVFPNLISMISFRLIVQFGSFLLALQFKKSYSFYSVSFAIAMIFTIVSGAILPVSHLFTTSSWLSLFHPLQSSSLWLLVFIVCICIWYVRKEKSIA